MYKNHSKFFYTNKDSIQDAINNGILNANDIIICEDTNEMIIIKDDLSLIAIKSKVLCFSDIETAIQSLNTSDGTYPGEIVAILNNKNGKYEAYVVNLSASDIYTVDPLSITSDTIFDYDSLGNRPIDNIYGEDPANPVVLEDLESGIYKVNGNYKISESSDTVFSSMSNNLFIVSHEDGVTTVKKIGTDITDYIINESGDISETSVATIQYLEEKGYITQDDLTNKLAALDYISKEEAETYISELISETVETLVADAIEQQLDLKFEDCTELELVGLFSNK